MVACNVQFVLLHLRYATDTAAKVGSLSQTDVECLGQTSKIYDGQQEEMTLCKSTRLKQLPSTKYQDFFMLEEVYQLGENYVSNNKGEQSVSGASDNSECLDKTYSISYANDCSENTLLSDSSNILTAYQKLSTEVNLKLNYPLN